MKFIAYSDPHAHPHQNYSKLLPDGMNSRLKNIVDVVREIYNAANRLKIPVISGGDMFQVKNSMHVLAYNEIAEILKARSRCEREECDIICIGNHDIATHDGTRHALEPLIGLPGLLIPPDDQNLYHYSKDMQTIFVVIPYQMEHGRFSQDKFNKCLENAKHFLSDKDAETTVLISHLFTHELMKKHLDRDGDFSGAELLDIFDLVLLGHHHIHDVIEGPTDALGRTKKVISIGSPIQLRSDERGEKKGYLIIDTDDLTFEFVPIESPEFHLFDGEKAIVPEKIEGDFVTVKVKSKAEAARVEKVLERAGVAEYRIEVIPEKKTSRIDLVPGAKDDEIIDKYLASEWGKTDLDPALLKKKGMAYLM